MKFLHKNSIQEMTHRRRRRWGLYRPSEERLYRWQATWSGRKSTSSLRI